MDPQKNLCALVVEVVGRQRLVEALGSTEAAHAIERCENRIERAVVANNGELRQHTADRSCVVFERCDAAALAASEMLERVQSLPPLRGLRMAVRIGLHYGGVDARGPAPDATQIAGRLAEAAQRGQALATAPVVMLLSAPTRQVVGAEVLRVGGLEGLEWPLYALGGQTSTTQAAPRAPRPGQRLRIRHQHDIVFVEEQRPVLLFGREKGNDVVIADPRASRQHVRIERRGQSFVLVDQSTNGTYVFEEGGDERCIRHEEMPLVGPGRIGCGFSAKDVERDLVFFEIV